MKNTVLQFLEKYNLKDKTLIVGFSGGHDSMCLLDVLYKLSKSTDFKLIAAHFNHNWRGIESKMEQEVCRKFCEERGIEFYTKTATPMKQSEAVARALRYRFFNQALEKYSADAFLTAHNKNDNAETLLYRVIKGTGITGLKGIAEKRDNIYRPLLEISREEIEAYCKKNHLVPNNDSSNADIKYKRNFIRHEIIPMAKEINENVINSINSLSKVAEDELNIINEYMSYVKSVVVIDETIITDRYLTLSDSVKRKLIYEMLVKNNIEYDSEKVYSIFDFIEKNSASKSGIKMSLSSGVWVYVSSKIIDLVIQKPKLEDETLVRLDGEYTIGDYIFEIATYYGDGDIKKFPEDGTYSAYVDLSNTDLDFVLRTRNDGDVINPLGMTGTMKLKKYLISKGVPQHKKDDLILLCQGNEVLWVAGLGLSNKIQVKNKPTHIITLKHK